MNGRAAGAAEAVIHGALVTAAGAALGSGRLSHRQKVAALVQGAALLSVLAQAGWRLSAGWRCGRVDGSTRLLALRARPGRSQIFPQTQLARLLRRLFGPGGPVAGRGQACRVARGFLDRWGQNLAPVSADLLVQSLLEAAPFLWERPFAAARAGLVGEIRSGGSRWLWVAGGHCFRRRLLAESHDLQRLRACLRGPDAGSIWRASLRESRAAGDSFEPRCSARPSPSGRGWGQRIACARALLDCGRFDAALSSLRGLREPPALILRAACQLRAGRIGAARWSVRRLERAGLRAREARSAAEVAVPVLCRSGDLEEAGRWLARAQQVYGRGEDLRVGLLAAEFACWRRARRALERQLEACRGALELPALAWRWHRARGLGLLAADDAEGALHAVARAFRGRRCLPNYEAGQLWRCLASVRRLAGDLAGAERACLRAFALLSRCEGARTTLPALLDLAGIRLRRGRPEGVAAELRRARPAGGDALGTARHCELLGRLELVRGHPGRCLAHLDRALRALGRGRLPWRRAQLHLLRARCFAWLGDRPAARAELDLAGPRAAFCLEREERPAVWAQAGDVANSWRMVEAAGCRELWESALRGEEPAGEHWEELADLEPFRAARLVFDLELVMPGVAPSRWRQRAIAVLRRARSFDLAVRLERVHRDPWRSLAVYLSSPAGGSGALARLLEESGYPEARLTWVAGENEVVLADGRGGDELLAAPLGGGRLELSAPAIDDTLRALFAVAVREARPPRPPELAAGAVRPEMIGDSPNFRAALGQLERLARSDIPILILGETGTGKELAARRVHAASPRRARPFVAINCAALSESLLLSDLFGHARGAFTGAHRDRAGVFEAAGGGTVFLDEIGDLPLTAQGSLLRVLQEGEVRRVGENAPRKVEVRIVAATHQELPVMVENGNFRQDLFFRLKVGKVGLPPLRERPGDVSLLIDHLLSRDGTGGVRVHPDARERLLAYPWPGNVRELENVLTAAAALADGRCILPQDLDLPAAADGRSTWYHQQLADFRRRLICEALRAAGGNRAGAARRLGLSRQALSYLVRSLAIA